MVRVVHVCVCVHSMCVCVCAAVWKASEVLRWAFQENRVLSMAKSPSAASKIPHGHFSPIHLSVLSSG